ncbi:MAG: hypothetical protein E7Z72_02580 [Methanocorpusculum parvum]|nr:hypothetical protein [Methanocorpusculum parvum]
MTPLPHPHPDLPLITNIFKAEFINASYTSSLNDKYVNLTLSESNSCHQYSVNIVKVPHNYVLIKSDLDKYLPFKEKHADYCLIVDGTDMNISNCIIYIELKRGGANKIEVSKQLKGLKCLIEYCKIVAKECYNQKNFLSSFQEYYVCINHIESSRVHKRATSMRALGVNDTPNNFLSIACSGSSVNFNQCINNYSMPF